MSCVRMGWLLLLLLPPPPLREPVGQDSTSESRHAQKWRAQEAALSPSPHSPQHQQAQDIQLHLERREHKHMKIPPSGPRRHTTSSCRCCTYSTCSVHLYFNSIYSTRQPLVLILPAPFVKAPGGLPMAPSSPPSLGTRASYTMLPGRVGAHLGAHVMITRTEAREREGRCPSKDGSIRARHA